MTEALRDRVTTALSQSVRPEMATRFIVIMETMDTDGVSGLSVIASRDLTPWDYLGMLAYATNVTGEECDDEAAS